MKVSWTSLAIRGGVYLSFSESSLPIVQSGGIYRNINCIDEGFYKPAGTLLRTTQRMEAVSEALSSLVRRVVYFRNLLNWMLIMFTLAMTKVRKDAGLYAHL